MHAHNTHTCRCNVLYTCTCAPQCDFISVHVHYFNVATHHLLNASNLRLCKPGVHIINFSPARIVDGEAVRDMWDRGRLRGKYVSDFADPALQVRSRQCRLLRGRKLWKGVSH